MIICLNKKTIKKIFISINMSINYCLLLVILANSAQAEEKNNQDYYDILQPGIHPSAPLGHPEYKPSSTTTTTASSAYSKDKNIPTPSEAPNRTQDYYDSIREEAFERLLNTKIPLSPEQVVKFNQELDKNQKAINTNPTTPPQPISSSLDIDLSPGTAPPLVRLAVGFVSSLIFLDATGQPWPIADYSLGNPENLNIQWDKKTNALFIQSTAPYVTANLAVRLIDLDTPVMISLITGQRQVDYRVDFQIRSRGPNASPQIGESIYTNFAMPPSLLKVLDGVPPQNSKELQVSNNCGRAWLYNGKMIFRTNLTVLSPAWNATVSSADGTKVYEFMQTPLILASKDGKTIRIEISGF